VRGDDTAVRKADHHHAWPPFDKTRVDRIATPRHRRKGHECAEPVAEREGPHAAAQAPHAAFSAEGDGGRPGRRQLADRARTYDHALNRHNRLTMAIEFSER